MKKIFLICCLVATANVVGYAQDQKNPKVVSKNDFVINVNQLNTLLDNGKNDEAKIKWTEVHNMIRMEFIAMEPKYINAEKENDTRQMQYYKDIMHNQQKIYQEISTLQNDIKVNKSALCAKLKEFANYIL